MKGEHYELTRDTFRSLQVLQAFMARARGKEAKEFAITLRSLLEQAVKVPEKDRIPTG